MKKEVVLTWAAIAVCLTSLGLFLRDVAAAIHGGNASLVQGVLLASLIIALVYGSLVYLTARCGYLRRSEPSAPRSRPISADVYGGDACIPRLCVLIPSYKEEVPILRQTVVSAALCEFPSRSIVVLIDDPPSARRDDFLALQRVRDMLGELDSDFRAIAAELQQQCHAFTLRSADACDVHAETERIAALYDRLAATVETLGAASCSDRPNANHTDKFFMESVIGGHADAHRARARSLRSSSLSIAALEREYRRLASLFDVSISSFERKQFTNLSHAPNKAMNLNSYIGLMGRSFRRVRDGKLERLEPCTASKAELVVADADYLFTLDADSLVLADYLMTLVDIMEQDSAIAVAQTPYSAIPGSDNHLERAAGAQTDVQYIVHQGFTAFNATFWVGANAVLRMAALRDIQTIVHEDGNNHPVFIQDRTVIEDTGSTVDLVRRGWRLHNHPARLAYSATPQDFGSLIIQRRRWSNGGLIIFPDLLRHALQRSGERPSLQEFLLRTHYLCSPALGGFSVLLLLLLPFADSLQSPWVAATALPYYALYARDLRRLRYRWRELLHIYALGLMLLPINLAGVLRSIQQIVTGRKAAFGRTPKVEERTPTPPLHVLLQIALMAAIAAMSAYYAVNRHYYLAVFCALNFALTIAGFALFIGPRNALADLKFGWGAAATTEPIPVRGVKQPVEGARIGGLDGLRAYAITLVFLVHFLAQYFNGVTGPRHIDFDAFEWTRAASAIDAAAYYFWASHYGVDLFFLLSGFLIFRLVSRPGFNYLSFLGHRFMRLYPAFAVALLIYCAYVGRFWNLHYDWTTILANMLMLQGVWELGIKPIIVPTWSLTFEWLFYLTFPALILCAGLRRKVSLLHLAMIAAVLTLTIVPIGPHYIRFLMFVAGGALAAMPPTNVKNLIQQIPDIGVVLVFVLANLLFVDQQNYYRFIPVFMLTSFLLVAKVVYGAGLLHRLFTFAPLCRLGKVSFSFYLLHGLMIIVVCDHLAPMLRGLPEPARFAALIIAAFTASTAVASLSYRLLEQPYFEFRHARLRLATAEHG